MTSRGLKQSSVFAALLCLPLGCRQPATPTARVFEAAPRTEAAPEPAVAPREIDAQNRKPEPFSWDALVLVSTGNVGGPGLRRVARVGQELSVMVGDEPPRTGRIDNADLCEMPETPDECDGADYVTVQFGDPGREDGEEPSLPTLWSEPGVVGDGLSAIPPSEDIALLETYVAVSSDMSLPRLVPHTLEVWYANALCEADAEEDAYVLLRTYSSAGPDPTADATAVRHIKSYPRRIVTLRTEGRTLHFVTMARLKSPRSGRMFDIPHRFRTAFWILEEAADGMKVLHEERHQTRRGINLDNSCQLPLSYPTPWSVVEVDGVVNVLTRTRLTKIERWILDATGFNKAGSFEAPALPY